jgi:cobyrinic acid a,c-diamide synthase
VASAASAAALLISAPASGEGKTTVTASLARHAARSGLRVRVFKTGPDFIDPMILERACGHPVYQLDLWMCGRAHCRGLLHRAAVEADLILIEGVMGLYDGQPSSADLAEEFGVPVAVVIDAGAMAQTFGAVALGLRRYRPALAFHGVLANFVAGQAHGAMLAESMQAESMRDAPGGPRFLGFLARDAALTVPDRHLGLVQAAEIEDLEARLDRGADAVAPALRLEELPRVSFEAQAAEPPAGLLAGARIAVARDAALSFIYPANLDLLRAMGAAVSFFSPLEDRELPQVDAVYLPGGYPELHAERLAANRQLLEALRAHVEAGRPMLAECGGMMLLLEQLTDLTGRSHAMAGVLPGATRMQSQLQALALQAVKFEEGELRGHSFHHSLLSTAEPPFLRGRTQRGAAGEAVFRRGRLTASYIHFYWPSSPAAAASLFLP